MRSIIYWFLSGRLWASTKEKWKELEIIFSFSLMLVLGIEGLKLGQPIGCHLKTKMGMQTKREDPETKKKPPGAEFEGCKWCQQLVITWPASFMTDKDVESDSATSWGVREYTGVYIVDVSYVPLCWGPHGLGQTVNPRHGWQLLSSSKT